MQIRRSHALTSLLQLIDHSSFHPLPGAWSAAGIPSLLRTYVAAVEKLSQSGSDAVNNARISNVDIHSNDERRHWRPQHQTPSVSSSSTHLYSLTGYIASTLRSPHRSYSTQSTLTALHSTNQTNEDTATDNNTASPAPSNKTPSARFRAEQFLHTLVHSKPQVILSSATSSSTGAPAQLQPLETASDRRVQQLIDILNEIPGINLARVFTNAPSLIDASLDSISRIPGNIQWLTDTLHLDTHLKSSGGSRSTRNTQLAKIVNGNAHVLVQNINTTIQPCVKLLRDSIGFTVPEMKSIVLRFPRVLVYRVAKLEGIMSVLRQAGLNDAQIKIAIWKAPSLLALSPVRLRTALTWIENQGLHRGQIALLLTRFPSLPSYSIANNLQPKFDYLKTELAFSQEAIVKLLIHAPDVLGRSLETIQNNVAYAEQVAGFDQVQLQKYFQAYPGLLRINLNLPRYALKLQFLEEELGRDVASALASNPMYLTYGIERIATRGMFLQQRQRSTFPLSAWLSCNEKVYLSVHAKAGEEEFDVFKEAWYRSEDAVKWLEGEGVGDEVEGV